MHEAMGGSPGNLLDPLGLWNWEAFGEGLWSVITEPFKASADLLIGVHAWSFGTDLEDVQFTSMSAQMTQNKIISGQKTTSAILEGEEELGKTILSLGIYNLYLGYNQAYQDYSNGKIGLEELDKRLSNIAGIYAGVAATAKVAKVANAKLKTPTINPKPLCPPKVKMVGLENFSLKEAIAALPEEEVLSTVYDARTNTLYVSQRGNIDHFSLFNKALKGEIPSKAGNSLQGGYIYKNQGVPVYKVSSGSINSRVQSVWESARIAGESVLKNLQTK